MRIRARVLLHAGCFMVVTLASVAQLSMVARTVAAETLGLVLTITTWSLVLRELLDCRTWELLAAVAKESRASTGRCFGSMVVVEVLTAGLTVIIGAACAFSLAGHWHGATDPLSVIGCIALTAVGGAESLMRVRLNTLGVAIAPELLRAASAAVTCAATAALFASGHLHAGYVLVLLPSSRFLLTVLLGCWLAVGARERGTGPSEQDPAPSGLLRRVIWHNLRGSGKLFLGRADRVVLPMVLPSAQFAAYDCARRVLDRLVGLGRPIETALQEAYFLRGSTLTARSLLQQCKHLSILAGLAGLAIALLALPICRLLYGPEIGQLAAPIAMVMSPMAIGLAQGPILPLLTSERSQRRLAVLAIGIAIMTGAALVLLGDRSVLASAAVVCVSTLVLVAANLAEAARVAQSPVVTGKGQRC
jgi:O-antigen/teichoic acid export membrane protein